MGNVDVPEELIDAHRRGQLVIFVGAGASMSPPSRLPNFKVLAEEVATDANIRIDPADPPDVLLGKADANPLLDVHKRVATRIGDPASQPNGLHKAIAALATSGPNIRIVTTNYDRHLSVVLGDYEPMEYHGPALPMGDDFEGLVYLHGTLAQEPRHLIATDEDFGRAYLRDGWAARFLERMFATYTVLFIGYSHNDVVMTYLGRALRPPSRRYVLIQEPPSSYWRHLRIEAVAYQVVDGSHAGLTEVVEKWASRSSMGLLDHRRQVAQLLSASPSGVPEEMSYLESVLADDDKVGFFIEHARSAEWLSWAAHRPQFRRLFDGSPDRSPLADWFVEHYVMKEEHSLAALALVQSAGGRLGPAVCLAIGLHLHRRQAGRPEWLSPWLVLLVRDAPESRDRWLDFALVASRWPEDRATALLIFEHLTEPQAVFQRSFLPDRPPTFDLRVRGDSHWLPEAWQKVFAPHLGRAASEVIGIVDGHLRQAHRMLTAAGVSNPGWDPLSFGRAAIEPHPQDQINRPIDILVDAARDCLETLLAGQAGIAYLDAWAASDVPLLRRLAVHGWAQRSDVSATAKVAWLRERAWLFDSQLWHEVFRLIEVAIGGTDREVADAVVADVLATSQVNVSDYQKYTALAWIARHAPELESVRVALAGAQAVHPEYREREHPEFRRWFESGWVAANPPMSVEALHHRIEVDPAAALTSLRQYEGIDVPFDGPSWDDAVNLVIETVQSHPGDGFRLIDVEGGGHAGIVGAVVRGWSGAALDDTASAAVVEQLGGVQLAAAAAAGDVARMLGDDGGNKATRTVWHGVPGARDLAVKVWAALESKPTRDPAGDDYLTAAINHPAGWLAQFWLDALAADWRAATDSWTGLPAPMRLRLEELIASDDDRAAMAQVILASRLHFLHGADQEWADRTILPLLDWGDEARARRAWDGFLSWGRWNDRLLEAGLLDFYLATAGRIGQFREDIGHQIPEQLAAVAVFSDTAPTADGWARTFTRTTDTKTRVEWLRRVGWLLAELDADAVEHQWSRWMRPYWEDRLKSTPIELTVDEASAMATWAVYLTKSVGDGVALAQQHSAHLDRHSRFLDDLAERISQAPTDFAELLVHLLRGTQPPFYDGYQLSAMVRSLRSAAVDVNPIIEQAVRLGCSDAPGW
ncbi:SIR2 family protein [Micromonospora sp. CA-259024]|uniref:SIR2 family protein n=1 Tax=Micromonospora sp. CA-259024 TaxID=3239965 RepID=UPI003D91CEF5